MDNLGPAFLVSLANWAFGVFVVLCATLLLFSVFSGYRRYRIVVFCPPGLVEKVTNLTHKRMFKVAYEVACNDGSFTGAVLAAGMSHFQYGLEPGLKSAAKRVKEQASHHRRTIHLLAGIAAAGPAVVAVAPALGWPLLAGIPLGAALSGPALLFRSIFVGRLECLTAQCEGIADDMLHQMWFIAHKPEK